MAARTAAWSSGKSLNTRRALPVSIHSAFSFGSVLASKSAQWGQVSEANSTIVMGASGLPRMRSSAVIAGPAGAGGMVACCGAGAVLDAAAGVAAGVVDGGGGSGADGGGGVWAVVGLDVGVETSRGHRTTTPITTT